MTPFICTDFNGFVGLSNKVYLSFGVYGNMCSDRTVVLRTKLLSVVVYRGTLLKHVPLQYNKTCTDSI